GAPNLSRSTHWLGSGVSVSQVKRSLIGVCILIIEFVKAVLVAQVNGSAFNRFYNRPRDDVFYCYRFSRIAAENVVGLETTPLAKSKPGRFRCNDLFDFYKFESEKFRICVACPDDCTLMRSIALERSCAVFMRPHAHRPARSHADSEPDRVR